MFFKRTPHHYGNALLFSRRHMSSENSSHSSKDDSLMKVSCLIDTQPTPQIWHSLFAQLSRNRNRNSKSNYRQKTFGMIRNTNNRNHKRTWKYMIKPPKPRQFRNFFWNISIQECNSEKFTNMRPGCFIFFFFLDDNALVVSTNATVRDCQWMSSTVYQERATTNVHFCWEPDLSMARQPFPFIILD
jgi:hypothetical protein